MATRETNDVRRDALRLVPYMGVIYVVAEAHKLGFYNGHPDWCNLGQGQPEIGEMAGAPARYSSIEIPSEDHAYGPVHGTVEFRQCVADHYNRLYRKGKRSRYTADNVAVASGGRLALSRAIFALGEINVGYQLPDYTAYEDMLGAHLHRISAIPIAAVERDGFGIPPAKLREAIINNGLDAFLVSNPCNPTGRVIVGKELASWVAIGNELRCTMLLDEFYSHFIYTKSGKPGKAPVSAAAFVGDVNKDSVLIFDGLTKSYRYPGWRVGWCIGPKDLIECMITAGSSIDGGPSRVMQRAAMAVLEPRRADQETKALRNEFARKRNLMIKRLKRMGVRFACESEGTFYVWGCLNRLKPPFNDADHFFRAALKRKVMTVPGEFFDVNPGRRRNRPSRFKQWMRFSFGPPYAVVERGLDRLEAMLRTGR